MTTRAEEIAADGPYRADWENGFSVVRDLNAPEGNKIMMMMPDNMEWFADRMNEARANGYKQGQQDRWISVEERLPNRFDTVLTYGKLHIVICWFADGIWRHHESEKENKHEVTHWMPLPPSPPNPEQR